MRDRRDMLLAAWEQLVLRRLVAAMPRWVTPDGRTAIGVAGAVVTAASYAAASSSRWWLRGLRRTSRCGSP